MHIPSLDVVFPPCISSRFAIAKRKIKSQPRPNKIRFLKCTMDMTTLKSKTLNHLKVHTHPYSPKARVTMGHQRNKCTVRIYRIVYVLREEREKTCVHTHSQAQTDGSRQAVGRPRDSGGPGIRDREMLSALHCCCSLTQTLSSVSAMQCSFLDSHGP